MAHVNFSHTAIILTVPYGFISSALRIGPKNFKEKTQASSPAQCLRRAVLAAYSGTHHY